jgi:hypothetical protein
MPERPPNDSKSPKVITIDRELTVINIYRDMRMQFSKKRLKFIYDQGWEKNDWRNHLNSDGTLKIAWPVGFDGTAFKKIEVQIHPENIYDIPLERVLEMCEREIKEFGHIGFRVSPLDPHKKAVFYRIAELSVDLAHVVEDLCQLNIYGWGVSFFCSREFQNRFADAVHQLSGDLSL